MSAPTLSDLKTLDSDARSFETKSIHAHNMATALSNLRTGGKPLYRWLQEEGRYEEEVRSLLQGVINELGAHLVMVVEHRQMAFAFECSAKAAAKRATLAATVSPEVNPAA